MKLFFKAKDGGKESSVTGYWLLESKSFISIALLKFEGASRPAYHTHAFNSVSWILSGCLFEFFLGGLRPCREHFPSIYPLITRKDDFHMVSSLGTSWAITFRGPWDSRWKEFTDKDNGYYLRSGRIKDGEI